VSGKEEKTAFVGQRLLSVRGLSSQAENFERAGRVPQLARLNFTVPATWPNGSLSAFTRLFTRRREL
jgi:hypothetical protein